MNIINEVNWLLKKVKCILDNTDDIVKCGITNTIEGHRIAKYACDIDINETVTYISNNNGIITYINESGTEFSFNTKFSTLVSNEDGTYTLTTDDGNSIIISDNESGNGAVSIISNTLSSGNLIATHYDGVSETKDIFETITTMSIDDSILSYFNEVGEQIDIQLPSGSISQITNTISGNRIATHYDGISETKDINETITVITDNQDGTYIYFNEENSQTLIDIKAWETKTSYVNFVTNKNKIGEYINEEDTHYEVNETVTSITNVGNNIYVYTNEDSTQFTIFYDDDDNEKNFDATDVEAGGHLLTVTNHNFGAVNEYVNLKFYKGSGDIYPLFNNQVYKFKIIDENTLYLYNMVFGDSPTGTGHSLTPQYKYENNIIIGNNIDPYKDNAIILGNSTHDTLYTQAKIGVGVENPKVALDTNGGISLNIIEVNSNYNVKTSDYVIVVDNNSGSQKTINLTVENEVSNGRIVVVKDKNYAQSTNIIIQAGSGYTIEGSSSTTINTNKGHKTFILKGNTWYII